MNLFDLAHQSLEEDLFAQDVTTASLESFLKSRGRSLPARVRFWVGAKEGGVFSGAAWAAAVSEAAGLELTRTAAEGARLEPGAVACEGYGPIAAVLAGERTLLNGLQYACGVATQTRGWVQLVAQAWAGPGPAPGVYHTRKTPPMLRPLALAGVQAGGGRRHRVSLADRVLFKENHKYLVQGQGFRLEDYVAHLVSRGQTDAIIEVESLDEALAAARAGARHLLLDNFSPAQVRETVARLTAQGSEQGSKKGLEIEVSGGLTRERLADYCLPGVTRLSVGALTRDVRTLDLSLDWEPA